MRGFNWTNEQTLYFIELYEKFPVLWDPKHPDHKNRVALSKAWLDLQRKFDKSIPVFELRKKKESLLSSYRPLKKKVLDSESGGNRTENVFKPHWYAYEVMDRFMSLKKRRKKAIVKSEDCCDGESETVDNIRSSDTLSDCETGGFEWTREKTLRFIGLYENFPVLWDPKNPEHKNKTSLIKAWKELQNQFDESVPVIELKKKKETLLSRYRPLKRRVSGSKSDGKRGKKVFKPMWYAYDALDRFLGFKEDKKPTIESEGELDEEIDKVDEFHNNQALQEDDGETSYSDNSPVKNDDVKTFHKPKYRELKNKALYKKRKEHSSKSDMLMTNSLKEVAQAMKILSSREYQQQDQCSVFGQLIASQLRQLSSKNRVKAQVRLSSVLGEVLLGELELESSARASSQASGSSD